MRGTVVQMNRYPRFQCRRCVSDQFDAGIDACAKPLGADLCARIDDVHRAFSGTDATYARLD